MRIRHTALTSTYANVLDTSVYAGRIQGQEENRPLRENHSTPKLIDKSQHTLLVLLLLMLLQLAIPMSAFSAGYSVDDLRVYTHSRVISFSEFICIDSIIMKESHYNYLAVNGSHMGIGQMRSKYYQSKDPYSQIDLTIKYVHMRYKTMCKAWSFHKKHGYY